MSKAWKFPTEWEGNMVWVYSLSEPAARRNEIPGPASMAVPVDLPENIEIAFGYQNGASRPPSAVLASAESGEIVEVFRVE